MAALFLAQFDGWGVFGAHPGGQLSVKKLKCWNDQLVKCDYRPTIKGDLTFPILGIIYLGIFSLKKTPQLLLYFTVF